MSMDEMLLQELYGSQQVAAEEEIKQAQIQLVEAVAAEAGVDLNQLSDAELSKFAEYVLSDEDEEYDLEKGAEEFVSTAPRSSPSSSSMYDKLKGYIMNNPGRSAAAGGGALALTGGALALRARKKRRASQMMAEKGASYEQDLQTKLAEADMIGRQMARSYADEIATINSNGDTMNDTQMKVASAMSHVAAAWQAEMFGEGNIGALRSQINTQEKTATLANAGYVGLAKIASYTPDQFAAEAELRAAEILAAYGVNPETLDDIHPTNVKLSSFPGVQDAADREEAAVIDEYNQMLDTAAMHIIENLLD